MSREAMNYDIFEKIVATDSYTIPATNLSYERKIQNTNWMLGMDYVYNRYGYGVYKDVTYEYACGIKTGNTDEAGQCLASVAKKDELKVYTIILGAQDVFTQETGTTRESFSETIRMCEWAFNNFKSVLAFKENVILGSVSINDGIEDKMVNVAAGETLLGAIDNSIEDTEVKYTIKQTVKEAPVSKGDVVGSVAAYVGETCVGETDLISLDDIKNIDSSSETSIKEKIGKGFLIVILIIVIASGILISGKIYLEYLRRKRRKQRRLKRIMQKQREYTERE